MKTLRIVALIGAAIAFCSAVLASDIGPPQPAPAPASIATNLYAVDFDDGAHAFLPKLESAPITIPATYPKLVQEEPPAQSNWSGAWIYRLDGPREDRASAGILTKITTLTNVAGKFTLSLDGFAGFTLRDSAPTAAILLGANIRIADQLSGALHGGVITSQGKPTGACIGASLNLTFAGIK